MNEFAASRPGRRSRGSDKRGPGRLPIWACVLIAAGLLALLAIVLLLMGRPLWCKCGYVKLWHGVVQSSENSQHFTDWYTFSHIIHGFGLYGVLWLVGQGGRSGCVRPGADDRGRVGDLQNTDFVINRYREETIALDYYGDSVINSAGDVLGCALGLILAARLPVWGTVIVAVAIEGILAYAIRDNLTLNIIMLIYPLEAIKQWQLGA